MEQGKISVIVLNWNGKELLKRYLPSVVKYSVSPRVEVVVADNGSTDGSIEFVAQEYPSVKILDLGKNWGFAEGYNRAVDMVQAEYVLLLNSDVEVTEGWLEPLIQELDNNPQVAAVQPKLLAVHEPDSFEYAGACGGFIDKFGYPFCRGRILNTLEKDSGQYDNPCNVFWCSGAAILLRKELYVKAGGLDAQFFAHMEEIDLCWRIARMGYQLMSVPISVVYHLGGGTLPMNHPKKLKLNYRNNLLMLFKNLTRQQFCRVMMVRCFMDMASLMIFLLKGEGGNAKSVIQAYKEFFKMKKSYTHAQTKVDVRGVYPASVVWGYYVEKSNTFNSLKYKLSGGNFVK